MSAVGSGACIGLVLLCLFALIFGPPTSPSTSNGSYNRTSTHSGSTYSGSTSDGVRSATWCTQARQQMPRALEIIGDPAASLNELSVANATYATYEAAYKRHPECPAY